MKEIKNVKKLVLLAIATTMFLSVLSIFPIIHADDSMITLFDPMAEASDAEGTESTMLLGSGCWMATPGVDTNGDSYDKFEFYFYWNGSGTQIASDLGSFTIDEIDHISYHTNKSADGGNPDFYLLVYTMPDGVDDYGWYGYRLNAEPYFSNSLDAPANQWNRWNTDDGTNQFTFFDFWKSGTYGFYGQPDLQDLQSGTINWASDYGYGVNQNIDYGAEQVMGLTLSTGSAWSNTFNGYLDAIEVQLTTGEKVTIDLEACPDTVYVDDDWASIPLGQVVDGHIFGSDAFASIQTAIDYVCDGGTIYVAAGTYNENVLLYKHVNIIGSGSGTDGSIITQDTAGSGDTFVGVIQLNASGNSETDPILLKDLRIEPVGMAGLSVGRFYQDTETMVSFVELNNIYVVGTNTNPSTEQERGLYVDTTSTLSYLKVIDSKFNNLTYGWYFQKQVSEDDSTVEHVTVTNTEFNHNNHKGLYAEKLEDATFTDCIISENGFNSSALPTYFAPWSAGVDLNLKAGTYDYFMFDTCVITDNAIDESKEGVGLTVKGRGTGLDTSYATFPAYVNDVTVTMCTITNNERGLRFGEPGKENTMPTNVTVQYCNIVGNVQHYSGTDGTTYGGLINQMQAGINAECNWWGHISGPSGDGTGSGDVSVAVIGSIDFTPWLDKAYPDGDCIAGECADLIWVDDDQTAGWYDWDHVVTIQTAVDRVCDGGTIYVAAGTYNDQVIITKAVTIIGEGASTTIIDGLYGTSSTTGQIRVNTVSGVVDISGFTITQPVYPSGSSNDMCMVINAGSEATVTVHECVFMGYNWNLYSSNNYADISIYDNVFQPTNSNTICFEKSFGSAEIYENEIYGGGPVFFMSYKSGSNPNDVTTKQWVHDNYMDCQGGSGIVFVSAYGNYYNERTNGSFNNIEISDNIIEDVGDYQKGIQLEVDGDGGGFFDPIINGNEIIAENPGTGTSRGIRFLAGVIDAIVTENNITGFYRGVYQSYSWGLPGSLTPSGNQFHDNNFIDCEIGIENQYTDQSNSVDGSCNWWGDISGPTYPSGNPNGIGANVSENVDFAPWLEDLYPYGDCTGTPCVDQVWVDDDASPGWYDFAHVSTMQMGIDHVCDGGTVLVFEGTYAPFIVEGRNDILITVGRAPPVITGNQQVWETVYNAFVNNIVCVNNSVDIDIIGFDIVGTNPGGRDFSVFYQNSSGTLQNCLVNPNNVGNMNALAIRAIARSDLTVDNCDITNYGRIAIYVRHGTTLNVLNSRLIGHVYTTQDGDFVNYGIEIEGVNEPCIANIIGNEIYNHDYIGDPSWSSAGILVDSWRYYGPSYNCQNSTVTIEQNDIHDNMYGMEIVANANIHVNYNNIYDNSEYGAYSSSYDDGTQELYYELDAECNWWNHESGPSGNASGLGDEISAYVKYYPWLDLAYPDGNCDGGMNVHNINTDEWYDTIQQAIDNADPYDVLEANPGYYNEILYIDFPVTVLGTSHGICKAGYSVPADYAWDDTTESIIQPPLGHEDDLLIHIYDTDDVTFDGFIVQALERSGSGNRMLMHVEAQSQTMENINIINNIIGPNTNVLDQDGNKGRMNLDLDLNPYDASIGIVESSISCNKIFDSLGNGDNVFIWGSYHAYGATGPSPMTNTYIEDNEICGAHRCGIETAGGFTGLTIRNNDIHSNTGNPVGDEPSMLKYGTAILMIRGSGDREDCDGYGPDNCTIENNDIYNNEKNGIYMGPKNNNVFIHYNNIYENGWDAVRVDLIGNYWNPDFDPNPGPYTCLAGSNNVLVNENNIWSNGNGTQVIGIPSNGFVVDATCNWWDDITGPSGEGTGNGDSVSINIDFVPWLDKTYPDGDCVGGLCADPVWVDDDAVSGWYDWDHVATIQTALDRVCEGGTVYVASGSYIENLLVDKSVNLIGDGRDTTFVHNSGDTAQVYTIKIDGNLPGLTGDVLVEGLTFNGSVSWNAVVATDHIPSGITLTFRDNMVNNGFLYGWWDYHSHGNFECHNNIFSNVEYGMMLEGWDTGDINIYDNEFHLTPGYFGTPAGMFFFTYDYLNCTNPYYIAGNSFDTDSPGYGVVFYAGYGSDYGAAQYTDVTIEHNEFNALGYYGILLRNYGPIDENDIGGVHNALIEYNNFTDCNYAVRVYDNNSNINVHQNNFYHTSGYILETVELSPMNDDHFPSVQYGELPTFDIALFGVDNTGIYTVDATCNWWGDITGPYHVVDNPGGLGCNVSDTVTFLPWLTDEFPYGDCTGGLEQLDIEQTVQDRGFPIRHAVDGDWGAAQNFTPTLNHVSKVELNLRKFGTPEFDLVVELRADGPQGTLLDTMTFTPSEVPSTWDWLEIDFEDQYVGIGSDVFIVIPPAPSGVTTSFGYEWGYAFGDQYPDGSFWFTRDGGGLWRDLPTMYEFVFKTYGY